MKTDYKHAWESCVYVTKLPSKAVLEFSFLLSVCLPLHFVSSFSFLIYKQLFRKEVFPVVVWNIEMCSQSSKQWVHRCRTCSNEVHFGVFRCRNLTLIPVTKNKWFWNKTWTFKSHNISERLVLFSIFSTKLRDLTEALWCLVLCRCYQQHFKSDF